MPTLRSRKRLTCFYCGKRSHLQFEGQKSFDCRYCDATNWLDEYGNITDVPASNLPGESAPVRYAIPRTSTRSPSPTLLVDEAAARDPIFCDRCLRNQHLVTSVLAQYEWPDETSGPELAAAERKFWALRKDMENRYPQMCADCEPKVEKGLREASYTARTDHLRRMMDRTRTRQQETRRRGILDVFDFAGRWTWHLGFMLQFWWHVAVLASLLGAICSEENYWVSLGFRVAGRLGARKLPHEDHFIRWAIHSSMLSFPWNPRFKQTIRGFTSHILGFKQWYTYQILIFLIRLACLSISIHVRLMGVPATTMLGAQVVMALLMIYIHQTAPRSIRTDTTPLFRQEPKSGASRKPNKTSVAPQRESNDLGDILDDILHSPTKAPSDLSNSPPQANHQAGIGGRNQPSSIFRNGSAQNGHAQRIGPSSSFGALSLSDSPMSRQPEPQSQSQSQVHYDEEMDWSPSASQHRAFSTYNPYKVRNTNPRFSDTPIEPKAGPIWYKVPPAPTTPAQRLRNPPLKPIIRESPKDNTGVESIFQKKRPGEQQQRASNNSIFNTPPPSQSFSQSQSDITFAEPKFYAPEPQDDPRDGLTRMFASSFSISPGPDDEAMRRSRATRAGGVSSFVSKFTGAGAGAGSLRQQRGRRSRAPRIAEFVVLLGALVAWLRAPGMPQDGVGAGAGFGIGGGLHGGSGSGGLGLLVALASLGACLLVSVRLAADLLVDEQLAHEHKQQRQQQQQQQQMLQRGGSRSGKPDPLVPRRPVLAPSCANLACLQVVAALVLMWTVWSGQAGGIGAGAGAGAGIAYYGNALFGVVVAHQTWHVFS